MEELPKKLKKEKEKKSSAAKKEKEIIELKFGFTDDGPLTYEEVGQRFGVTRERIRQIEARVLEKLRSKINKELFTFND